MRACVLLLGVALVACEGTTGGPESIATSDAADAARPDAPAPDGPTHDARPDAAVDVGVQDAAPDQPSADVASADAASPDADLLDSPMADAPPPDLGMNPDAPATDAASPDVGPDVSLPDMITDAPTADTATMDAGDDGGPALFSFFVTSLETMQDQSGSVDGFGGDLGGLAGADAICQTAATNVGFGFKTWRAFLSVTDGGTGSPVHAIDRVGPGPWYDRNGRLIANDVAGLQQTRPAGDPQTIDDLPDEFGVPLTTYGDSHDVLTGSDAMGYLSSTNPVTTCQDWTSIDAMCCVGQVLCGHAWPAMSGMSWIEAHPIGGCEPGVNLVQMGPPMDTTVGSGGGWGGIYCFALEP